ncbi:MAG: phosphoadenosine phosphosulfate reductase [Cyanobacteria bacterium J06632_22]
MVQCLDAPERTVIYPAKLGPSPVNLDTLDLAALNQQFDPATPQQILAWCLENIPHGLVQMTSFSMLAVTHMLYTELHARIPVVFIDTLHLFPETLATAAKAREHYNLELHRFSAADVDSRSSFASRYGEALWERDVVRFHHLTKVEPLQRALDELQVTAWITGRRRDQSANRQDLPIFERDTDGRLKINPLAHWNRKAIWRYTFEQNVLYNPLHDQGYTSIGDQPLTTKVQAGEDERAGRWRGSEKTECGIHV